MLSSIEVDKNLLATTIKFDLLNDDCADKSSFAYSDNFLPLAITCRRPPELSPWFLFLPLQFPHC